ncbi:hypothetical protein ACFY7H_10920 [Streptomyces sp. NPDC012794]|uniref:hypothetical protein n=1 Tax=Streptomyces sp. NPDC012794 TaxID=3364850 RepID=UPI0036801DC5
MNPADEDPQQLDPASLHNARTTLVQLLGRAGVPSDAADELIGLVEAGVLAAAHREIGATAATIPGEKGEPYAAGRLDGARALTDALGDIAERALARAVGAGASEASRDARTPVRRMEVERAKVAVTPLYLSFSTASDLDPEVSEQVLTAVLATMSPRRRAAYAGRLTRFADDHRARLQGLYARYGPGSTIALHGRHSLLHSPTSIAVLERLDAAPTALRQEWDAAELPPSWLDGLTTSWAPAPADGA